MPTRGPEGLARGEQRGARDLTAAGPAVGAVGHLAARGQVQGGGYAPIEELVEIVPR